MNAEPCLDVATLEKLTQIGGKEFATEMINLFLSYVPKKLAEARAAGQTGDRLGVRNAVHPIKSSAANIGARPMRDLAARIEQLASEQHCESMGPLLTELEAAFEQVKAHLQEHRKELGP